MKTPRITFRRRSDSSDDLAPRGDRPVIKTPPEKTSAPGRGRGDIKTWLINLIRADDPTSPQAKEAVKVLREIEASAGGYIVATDIMHLLTNIPEKAASGAVNHKDRGYGLAAELFIRKTYEELEAIETKGMLMGPTIFEGHCTEFIDALFARSHARKGVEAPLAMMDYLLRKSLHESEYWHLYLDLAVQAVRTTINLTAIKFDQEDRRVRAAIRANRNAKDNEIKVEVPTPSIDQDILTYLRDVQRKIGQLNSAFEREMQAFRAKHANTADADPKQAIANRIALLRSLLRIATGIEYHPFTGMVNERLATLTERLEPGSSKQILKAGANYYELQGDKDTKLALPTLAKEHYKRAGQLYNAAQETVAAQRVAEKAGKQPDPEIQRRSA